MEPRPQAASAECEDLIAPDRIASLLGSGEVVESWEEYAGAARTVGGISCTWSHESEVVVISVLPRALITEPVEADDSEACINRLGHCFTSRSTEENILFVAGWDDEINRSVADEVEAYAASLELIDAAAPSGTPDCDALAPVLESAADIGALGVLGTDNVPLRPVWHILADAGAAHFCTWGGTESTDSVVHAVYIWAYPGLHEPRDAIGEQRTLGANEASIRELPRYGDVRYIEVTAWDGTNTVVVSGQGMTADAVTATAERLLETLAD